jgi:hypothetical protein
MEPMAPIYTAHLFAPLHEQLLSLLEALTPDDWTRGTLAGSWQVRDVVAHLLEVDLRRLSVGRDAHRIEPGRPIRGYADLVAFLNELNTQWVTAARRFSPGVLIDLLRVSGPAMARLATTLPPHDPAPFAVAWAGERQSENWFDIGRDYTERWHHQMQIREAVHAAGLLERRWLLPLLDLSVRSLPRAYEGILAGDVSLVLKVELDDQAVWTLRPAGPADAALDRDRLPAAGGWRVWRGSPEPAPSSSTTTVHLDPGTAWRLFYNALSPDQVRQRAVVDGDELIAEPLFRARAVMV